MKDQSENKQLEVDANYGHVTETSFAMFRSMIVASFFIDTVFDIEKYLEDVGAGNKKLNKDYALLGLPNYFYGNGKEVLNTSLCYDSFAKGRPGDFEMLMFNVHYQSPYADDAAACAMMESVFGDLQRTPMPSWTRRNRNLPRQHTYLLFDTTVKYQGKNQLNVVDTTYQFCGWLERDTLAFTKLKPSPF